MTGVWPPFEPPPLSVGPAANSVFNNAQRCLQNSPYVTPSVRSLPILRSSDYELPRDIEQHYLDLLNFTAPLRQIKVSGYAGFYGPWLENVFISTFCCCRLKEILAQRPGWQPFRDGCPDGESAWPTSALRADRIISQLRELNGNVLIFSSAHFPRVFAARWLGLPPQDGARLVLDTTSISVLGYEHDVSEPVIRRWNQV